MSTFIYASCKDINGIIEYLVAYTETDIEEYTKEKEIIAYYTNPDPIMVCHHFEWVGSGRRPPMLNISTPFYNEKADPKTGIRGHRIFKEKF